MPRNAKLMNNKYKKMNYYLWYNYWNRKKPLKIVLFFSK